MMCITQIGESVSRITESEVLSTIPVKGIIGLRNRIVHGYEEIDLKIISEVFNIHIPELKKTVQSLLGDTDY